MYRPYYMQHHHQSVVVAPDLMMHVCEDYWMCILSEYGFVLRVVAKSGRLLLAVWRCVAVCVSTHGRRPWQGMYDGRVENNFKMRVWQNCFFRLRDRFIFYKFPRSSWLLKTWLVVIYGWLVSGWMWRCDVWCFLSLDVRYVLGTTKRYLFSCLVFLSVALLFEIPSLRLR